MNAIAPLQDFDDPKFDPFAASDYSYGNEMTNPWPRLKELAAGGVIEADFREVMGMPKDLSLLPGDRLFMVFDSNDVRRILSNPEGFTNDYLARITGPTFGRLSLGGLNPPEHTRYRKLFQKAFLPQNVAPWNELYVAPAINDLIDQFENNGRTELMASFVSKYPFDVIFRQLDLPPDEVATFHKLSVALQLAQTDPVHGHEAHVKLGVYFTALIDQRRRNPGTDLISVLGTVELEGERLSDEALLSFFRIILGAAGDTAYRTTGSLLVALLSERPDQFELLKQDRSLIPAAIEEALRWEGPVSISYRTAARDTEIGGVPVPAGAIIQVITGMANRDPALYPDPDQFDLTRPPRRTHFGFGAGPHLCLGQHLARMEMAKALSLLLERLPKLRLDLEYPPPVIVGSTMRVPRQLHVRFD